MEKPGDRVKGGTAGEVVKRTAGGHRWGDSRPNAKLTEELVETARVLHEDHGLGYKRIKEWLREFHGIDLSLMAVYRVCTYRTYGGAYYVDRPGDRARRQRMRAAIRDGLATGPRSDPGEDE